ncbi:MAG: hypothetical protein WA118_04975 [Carboxydocellales bacterium]
MNWFSIVSILLFVVLIIRVIVRMQKKTGRITRSLLLILIFIIHIGVIIYLSFD